MSYLSLYRVWRPQGFSEVVGQEQTVQALRNAVRGGRLTHAFLFAGPRGTGKTSLAKIMAKAVNCENQRDGEPCNNCNPCRDINYGNFMDVIEIDAASNRGIDEIRDLREKVRILPAQGKKKVYIIDEVHMLTTEAFNALLKTLEEPPESVIFILATTELQKIPATILSRCQKYSFHRLTQEQIISRLRKVGESNAVDIEPAALALIARRANGGMRDALGMLEQVYSYSCQEGPISRDDVLEVLGLVDDAFVARLIDDVIAHDAAAIVNHLNAALNQGKEAGQLARETALYLRDLLISQIAGDKADMVMAGEQSRELFKVHSKNLEQGQILQALRMIMDTSEKLRFSEGQKFLLELVFLEISTLWRKPGSIASATAPQGKGSEFDRNIKMERTNRSDKPDAREVLWNRLLAAVKERKVPTHALLSQGKLLGTKGDTMYIGFQKSYKFHKERMEEKGNRDILDAVIRDLFARELEIEFIFLEDNKYNDIVVKKAIEFFGEDMVEIKD